MTVPSRHKSHVTKHKRPQDAGTQAKGRRTKPVALEFEPRPLSTIQSPHRSTKASEDEHWMRLALGLALKGRFDTSPNPMVGACVVSRGKLVGQGWHKRFGGPHAEVMALRQAGKRAKGASLYVTLEPCSSTGKTPPCVDSVIQAGVHEVVFAVCDPNPKHVGRARTILRKSGVRVRSGILAREAERQNETFFKWIQTGRPFVTLKMAQTLDGKIATRTGKSRWISSPESREFVQSLRRSHDAVLVGKNTLLADNPRLSVREISKRKFLKGAQQGSHRGAVGVAAGRPWRVVLDPRAEVPVNARVFKGTQPVFLAVHEGALKKAANISWKATVTLLPLKQSKRRLDLKQLLTKLGSLGASSLLVEGGGETAWSFLSQGLVDRVIWIVAPKFFGGRDAKTSVEGEGMALPQQAMHLKSWSILRNSEDVILEGRF